MSRRTRSTDRAPGRDARLAAWAAIVLLVVGLAVAPPWADVDELPAGFTARMIAGDLERETDAGWTAVREGELVAEGARVRSAQGAALTVTGGQIALADETVAVLGGPVTIEAGSLLTEAADTDRSVRVGGVLATGRGTWRVDAGPDQRVAVYDGGLGVVAEGASEDDGVAVRRYEQIGLLAGRLGEGPLPLRYRTDDLWDARLLNTAITVDREVERLQRVLAATYGSDPRDREFYEAFEAAGDDDLDAVPPSLYAEGAPGEVLTHMIVTGMLAERTTLGLEEAADEVVTLRRDGATWGLLLVRHGLDVEDLRDAVDLTLEEAPASPPATDAEPPADDTAEPEPDAAPDPGADPVADPDPPPAPPPDDEDDGNGPAGDLPDDVGETVGDVIEDLGDLIDDVTDPIGDLGGLVPSLLP